MKTSAKSKRAKNISPKVDGLRLAKIKDLQEEVGKGEVNVSDNNASQDSLSEKISYKDQERLILYFKEALLKKRE